ncbi:MAG TPA: hypothetical protein DCO75_06340 [Fibrobacteres bacterium]|nr:hypothetical protein [Fibrobacterota bacterium]
MSHRERDPFKIDETKCRIFERDHFRCMYPGCMKSATELAHHIGQGNHQIGIIKTTWNIEFKEQRNYRFIEAHVIHNDLNMSASCRKHNSYFNIGGNPGKVTEKLKEIRENLIQRGVI